MKTKKIMSFALASLMSAAFFSGCGNTTDNSAETTTASAGDTTTAAETTTAGDTATLDGNGATIKVLTHRTDRLADGGDGSLEEMTKAFEEKYNCKVEYQGFTDYETDVSTMLSTNDYGDVLMIPNTVKLVDLANFFEPFGTYEEMDAKYKWANYRMYDNKVYGVSHGGTASGILYNKKIWSDAGITELPKTPDEFIADLKLIKEKNPDTIPYYTEYADASWTLVQWQSLVVSASGDPNYQNRLLENKEDLFVDGDGYWETYELMFKLFSTPEVLETDHSTTQWEASKAALGEGKIATIVLGSWAISQFQQAAGDNAADVGYMPVPITAKDGKQYAQTSTDYNLGVNKNSKNIELAKAYVTWFADESGFAAKEGMIPPLKNAALPSNLEAFSDCVLFSETVAPDELTGKFNEIDLDSGVGTWNGDSENFKIKLAEAAFAGKGEAEMKKIFEEANAKWAASRDKILADYYASQQ